MIIGDPRYLYKIDREKNNVTKSQQQEAKKLKLQRRQDCVNNVAKIQQQEVKILRPQRRHNYVNNLTKSQQQEVEKIRP